MSGWVQITDPQGASVTLSQYFVARLHARDVAAISGVSYPMRSSLGWVQARVCPEVDASGGRITNVLPRASSLWARWQHDPRRARCQSISLDPRRHQDLALLEHAHRHPRPVSISAPEIPGRDGALGANATVRMVRIRGDSRQYGVLDGGEDAAPGYAHRAIGVQLLGDHWPFPLLSIASTRTAPTTCGFWLT
jgi:hypothetical protein